MIDFALGSIIMKIFLDDSNEKAKKENLVKKQFVKKMNIFLEKEKKKEEGNGSKYVVIDYKKKNVSLSDLIENKQNDQINANQDMREKLKDDLWVEFQKTLKKGKEKGMRLKKIHFSKLLLEHLEWCK